MNELRNKAKELLEAGKVQMIIGYEQSSGNKTRPVFIQDPAHVSRLIIDSRCVHNIAVYLTKTEIRKKGRLGIVATLPVLNSIIRLASENQINEKDLVIIGVSSDLQLIDFNNFSEIEQYVGNQQRQANERDDAILEKLSHMKADERWKFWLETLEPCFRCYACRAACPLCYCSQCAVDKNRPQWIPVASHLMGNLEWHIMRAMHMSGRCTDCGACADACPLGIPLNLLTKKMRQDLEAHFGTDILTPGSANALSTFKPDDRDNFIK